MGFIFFFLFMPLEAFYHLSVIVLIVVVYTHCYLLSSSHETHTGSSLRVNLVQNINR